MSYQKYPGWTQCECKTEADLLLEDFEKQGFFVLEKVFDDQALQNIRVAMDRIWQEQVAEFGENFLRKLGDWGQVRAMMLKDALFFDLIRHPVLFPFVSKIIGPTAILHLQNGIVVFPEEGHNQGRYHKDFPKDFCSTKPLSMNTFIAIDPFTAETGATWVVPGSHLFEDMPSDQYLQKHEIQMQMEPGSVLVFDSTLWHRSGQNRSGRVRRGLNQQYTRPFIKQQLDYPVLLSSCVDKESELAQTLGFWAVSPKSVQEFRVSDPAKRTYRAGQG